MSTYSIHTIATVRSPYKEKFGIPRQPRLANSLTSQIIFEPEFSSPEIIKGIEGCSHLWLIFIFNACLDKGWKPTVRPPRLGGNKRLGVFATRSPFRPNPLGLSAVSLESHEIRNGQLILTVSGADLLDGTPIVDIKPYLPYADHIPDALVTFAEAPQLLGKKVSFSDSAQQACKDIQAELHIPLQQQITELLISDPRPAYKKDDPEHTYGLRLHHLNIRFRITDQCILVDEITEE